MAEQKQWRPSKWTPGKINRFLLHVNKQAMWAVCKIVGEFEGNKLAAEFRADLQERKSVAALCARGVPLMGDK